MDLGGALLATGLNLINPDSLEFNANIKREQSQMFWANDFSKGAMITKPVVNAKYSNKWGDLDGKANLIYDHVRKDFVEADFALYQTLPVSEELGAKIGVEYFTYDQPGRWGRSGMVSGSVSTKNLPVKVSASVNQMLGDINDNSLSGGNYYDLKMSKDFDIWRDIKGSVSGQIAYNDKSFIKESGFSHTGIGAKLKAALGKFNLEATVDAIKSFGLNDKIKQGAYWTAQVGYNIKSKKRGK